LVYFIALSGAESQQLIIVVGHYKTQKSPSRWTDDFSTVGCSCWQAM